MVRDNIFTHDIQFTDFSMFHALICNLMRTPLKPRTNISDILSDKSIKKSRTNLVTSTARDQLAHPDWLFKWKEEYEVKLRSSSILTWLTTCALHPPHGVN